MRQFQGAMTALVTPFKDGAVDGDALENLVNHQIADGLHGLVPCGTTGEAAALSRMHILQGGAPDPPSLARDLPQPQEVGYVLPPLARHGPCQMVMSLPFPRPHAPRLAPHCEENVRSVSGGHTACGRGGALL